MEEVEEEFQSLSFHQHYTSSGVRSIPLQGGSAGSISAPTIPDHQLMEEEEDGASMHQPSSTAAAPSRSMALPLALLALLSATSMEAQEDDNSSQATDRGEKNKHSHNRRNWNRIRRSLIKDIKYLEGRTAMSREEKERKLEWL